MISRREQQILSPVVTRIRKANPELWESLKRQTQFGPEFTDFPYFLAALEMEPTAIAFVRELPGTDRESLVAEWRAHDRLIHIEEDADIIRQYGLIALDVLVARARAAGNRTSW
jgi:hypothetical protein